MPLRAPTCWEAYIPYSLTRERSKCEARGLEIALTTHAARRASVVSDTRDIRCLFAHLLARQPTSLTRLLTREVSVNPGAVEITLTTRAAHGVQA